MEPLDTHGLIDALKAIAQPVRLILFAGFVALGLNVRFSRGKRRMAIQLFLAYLLSVNAFVALVGTDAWPFSPYPMMAIDASDEDRLLNGLGFRLVHETGQESRVDPLAFSPLYPQALMGWLENHYSAISPAKRATALKFLYERAESARRSRLEGVSFGNRRVLGRLAAPDTNLYWEPDPLAEPGVALRIYRFRWNPRALLEDPDAFTKELVAEYVDAAATE